MNRRQFLALGAAAGAAMVLDPERALWVPGARTIFLPSTTLVEAATLADALRQGLVAVFPDGARMEIQFGAGDGMTLAQRLSHESAAIFRMGGRIVAHRTFQEHAV